MRRLTGRGGLATVDVADDDDVDMNFLLTVASMSAILTVLFLHLFSMDWGWRRQKTYPMLAVSVGCLK